MANVKHNWTQTDWPTAMDAAINIALTAVGIVLEKRAVDLCPVDPGRLRGSLTYATYSERDYTHPPATNDDEVSRPQDKHTLHVGTNVEYAPYVEYGYAISGKGYFWRKAGQSYLRRALDDSRKGIPKLFNDELHKAVLRYGK